MKLLFWKKKQDLPPAVIGLIQAFGIFLYVLLIVQGFIHFGFESLEHTDGLEIYMPILMLFLFSFSVLTCGTIVFGYPTLLAFQKRYKEASVIVLSTIGGMAVLLGLIIVWMGSLTPGGWI